MSVAVQNIEPFSEIEREIRKLESLLTEKAVEAEILHETLGILRADPMSEEPYAKLVVLTTVTTLMAFSAGVGRHIVPISSPTLLTPQRT